MIFDKMCFILKVFQAKYSKLCFYEEHLPSLAVSQLLSRCLRLHSIQDLKAGDSGTHLSLNTTVQPISILILPCIL